MGLVVIAGAALRGRGFGADAAAIAVGKFFFCNAPFGGLVPAGDILCREVANPLDILEVPNGSLDRMLLRIWVCVSDGAGACGPVLPLIVFFMRGSDVETG